MPGTSYFERNIQIITDGDIVLSKYKSTNSGMTICIAEADGPLVAGYLCIATEAHDDDGLPHTLEHLVFMGSENYPYKGVLDLLATRCLSSGTNAWTDTDHTCYTMSTAGDEGFLKLLPIYVDHLLFPTLTDAAFITEVHHINGEGEDAGVVYCEMQARENSGESRCHLAMLRSMYPGHCGYKSETGGLLKNLRESTTNEKIRSYHKEFYRPENLCVIIVGQIDANNVFEALNPIEEKIAKQGDRPTFIQPWKSPVPLLPESVVLEIDYPCDEDDYGLVIAAWRGPLANDYSQLISIHILMDYFTDTSVAPINRDFVEIDDPLCNQVDYTVVENSESCIYLHFSNVPVNKLKELKTKLFTVFQKVADGTEPLDMERMKTVIKKKKLNILSCMESSPHDQLAMCLIGDFLYGTTLEDLEHRVREIPTIEKLFEEGPEFWKNLLKKYIVDKNSVIVLGTPSPALSKQMSEQEKQRVKAQQVKLGTEGLMEKSQSLKKAMEANEVPPPEELLLSISVPSFQSIKFHPIKRTCNISSENDDIDYCVQKMPCRFQLDVIHTNFVRVYVLMDTSGLSEELRLYLPLFVELLDESPIERQGTIVPYQDVVKELAEDTISFSASLGLDYCRFFCRNYAQVICIMLMVEEEKYQKAVQWIREVLFQLVFNPSRIKSSINKMIADVATMKRSGSCIAKTMMKNLCFLPESNHWAASMLRQHIFLSGLLQKLDSEPQQVIKHLNDVRSHISAPERMTVHLSLNLSNLKTKINPEEPWIQEFLPSSMSPNITKNSIKMCHELMCLKKEMNSAICGVGSVQSSYLLQSAPCISSCTHPDYAPLLVLIQYLTQAEGPMWRQIRGLGLAYSYDIFIDPDQGLIYFILYKSTHLTQAYKEGINIVDSYLNGTSKWEKTLFESSCSSLVFHIIERIKTVADVTEESLTSYFKNVDMEFIKELLIKVSKVTMSDMQRVGLLYLKPLFDPSVSCCTICCHPSKVAEISEGFKKFSRQLVVVPSLEDSFMSKI